MTWIKICANTNLEDALAAVKAGADAVGFVFAESPRRVDAQQVRDITVKLPPEVERVGVFVNTSPADIRKTVKFAGLTAVQVYGEEQGSELAANLLADNDRPRVYRALSMKTVFSAASGAAFLRDKIPSYDAVLVDSGSATRGGGTGLTFDWTRAQPFIAGLRKKYKVIVAGGLTPENVGKAIDLFNPWGVDVASGVEGAPGKKDHAKVRAFIEAVREKQF